MTLELQNCDPLLLRSAYESAMRRYAIRYCWAHRWAMLRDGRLTAKDYLKLEALYHNER